MTSSATSTNFSGDGTNEFTSVIKQIINLDDFFTNGTNVPSEGNTIVFNPDEDYIFGGQVTFSNTTNFTGDVNISVPFQLIGNVNTSQQNGNEILKVDQDRIEMNRKTYVRELAGSVFRDTRQQFIFQDRNPLIGDAFTHWDRVKANGTFEDRNQYKNFQENEVSRHSLPQYGMLTKGNTIRTIQRSNQKLFIGSCTTNGRTTLSTTSVSYNHQSYILGCLSMDLRMMEGQGDMPEDEKIFQTSNASIFNPNAQYKAISAMQFYQDFKTEIFIINGTYLLFEDYPLNGTDPYSSIIYPKFYVLIPTHSLLNDFTATISDGPTMSNSSSGFYRKTDEIEPESGTYYAYIHSKEGFYVEILSGVHSFGSHSFVSNPNKHGFGFVSHTLTGIHEQDALLTNTSNKSGFLGDYLYLGNSLSSDLETDVEEAKLVVNTMGNRESVIFESSGEKNFLMKYIGDPSLEHTLMDINDNVNGGHSSYLVNVKSKQPNVWNVEYFPDANEKGNVHFGNVFIGINTNPVLPLDIMDNTAIRIPIGTTEERPMNPTVNYEGAIRVNQETNQFEYYVNGRWISNEGIGDADGDTTILFESSPGAEDNVMKLMARGNVFQEHTETTSSYINENILMVASSLNVLSNVFVTGQYQVEMNDNITLQLGETDASLMNGNFRVNNEKTEIKNKLQIPYYFSGANEVTQPGEEGMVRVIYNTSTGAEPIFQLYDPQAQLGQGQWIDIRSSSTSATGDRIQNTEQNPNVVVDTNDTSESEPSIVMKTDGIKRMVVSSSITINAPIVLSNGQIDSQLTSFDTNQFTVTKNNIERLDIGDNIDMNFVDIFTVQSNAYVPVQAISTGIDNGVLYLSYSTSGAKTTTVMNGYTPENQIDADVYINGDLGIRLPQGGNRDANTLNTGTIRYNSNRIAFEGATLNGLRSLTDIDDFNGNSVSIHPNTNDIEIFRENNKIIQVTTPETFVYNTLNIADNLNVSGNITGPTISDLYNRVTNIEGGDISEIGSDLTIAGDLIINGDIIGPSIDGINNDIFNLGNTLLDFYGNVTMHHNLEVMGNITGPTIDKISSDLETLDTELREAILDAQVVSSTLVDLVQADWMNVYQPDDNYNFISSHFGFNPIVGSTDGSIGITKGDTITDAFAKTSNWIFKNLLDTPPPVENVISSELGSRGFDIEFEIPFQVSIGFMNIKMPYISDIVFSYRNNSVSSTYTSFIPTNSQPDELVTGISFRTENGENGIYNVDDKNVYVVYGIQEGTYDVRILTVNHNQDRYIISETSTFSFSDKYIQENSVQVVGIGVPSEVLSLEETSSTLNSIGISWQSPIYHDSSNTEIPNYPDLDNYSFTITSYDTLRIAPLIEYMSIHSIPPTSTTFTKTSLNPGHDYIVTIEPKNVLNTSYGPISSVIVRTDNIPQPTNVLGSSGRTLTDTNHLERNGYNLEGNSSRSNILVLPIGGVQEITTEINQYILSGTNVFDTDNEISRVYAYGGLYSSILSNAGYMVDGYLDGLNITDIYDTYDITQDSIQLSITSNEDYYRNVGSNEIFRGFYKVYKAQIQATNIDTFYPPTEIQYGFRLYQEYLTDSIVTGTNQTQLGFYRDDITDIPEITNAFIGQIQGNDIISYISGVPTFNENSQFVPIVNVRRLAGYFLSDSRIHLNISYSASHNSISYAISTLRTIGKSAGTFHIDGTSLTNGNLQNTTTDTNGHSYYIALSESNDDYTLSSTLYNDGNTLIAGQQSSLIQFQDTLHTLDDLNSIEYGENISVNVYGSNILGNGEIYNGYFYDYDTSRLYDGSTGIRLDYISIYRMSQNHVLTPLDTNTMSKGILVRSGYGQYPIITNDATQPENVPGGQYECGTIYDHSIPLTSSTLHYASENQLIYGLFRYPNESIGYQDYTDTSTSTGYYFPPDTEVVDYTVDGNGSVLFTNNPSDDNYHYTTFRFDGIGSNPSTHTLNQLAIHIETDSNEGGLIFDKSNPNNTNHRLYLRVITPEDQSDTENIDYVTSLSTGWLNSANIILQSGIGDGFNGVPVVQNTIQSNNIRRDCKIKDGTPAHSTFYVRIGLQSGQAIRGVYLEKR